MLGNLGELGESEFYNPAPLFGIGDDLADPSLQMALAALPPIKRAKVMQKIVKDIPSRGSRLEMEKHFPKVPEHVRTQLAKGELQLADTIIYSIKPISSKTIKMFETQDDKEVGIRNISNAKLPKNQVMLVSGIVLLFGVAENESKDRIMATAFGAIDPIGAISNGEFSLKANKKVIVPDGTSNHKFRTNNYQNVPVGYFKLDNPRVIQDDVLIELTVELGTTTGIPANAHLFVGLHGTITTP
jgi:hypothetical protein